VADFRQAGGRTIELSDDDIRTMTALRDLISEDDAQLTGWLRARRPAHGMRLLQDAFGADGYAPPPPPGEGADVPETETETPTHTGSESVPDNTVPESEGTQEVLTDSLPLGVLQI
jgi:hypothetical protein